MKPPICRLCGTPHWSTQPHQRIKAAPAGKEKAPAVKPRPPTMPDGDNGAGARAKPARPSKPGKAKFVPKGNLA